jgi:hypothetical protein
MNTIRFIDLFAGIGGFNIKGDYFSFQEMKEISDKYVKPKNKSN